MVRLRIRRFIESGWQLIAYLAFVITIVGLIWSMHRDNEADNERFERITNQLARNQYETCLANNEARVGTRKAFDGYTAALIGSGANEQRTPEEERQRQEAIKSFLILLEPGFEALAPVDCEELRRKQQKAKG